MRGDAKFFRQEAMEAYKKRFRGDRQQVYRSSLVSPFLALIASVLILAISAVVWISAAVL